MPAYLKDITEFPELEKLNSVLIVPCRFCPAASMAVRTQRPYFEFLWRFLKTASYEELIKTITSNLEERGVRTDVFKSYWPHQFVVCMWTKRRRKKLLKRARKYEALVVLGCEAAVDTVHDAVTSIPCKVFMGMRSEGIMSIQPHFHMPCNLSLDLNYVTPLVHQAKHAVPWVSL